MSREHRQSLTEMDVPGSTPEMQAALQLNLLGKKRKRGGSRGGPAIRLEGTTTEDMLLHIGEGGRVKFAQRIDRADQVTATATKPGGAVARSKGGAGAAGVVINSFGNSAEMIRGIQAAVAAGIL